jgi:ornithine carbamoyltransferase
MKSKHLITIEALEASAIERILALAARLKARPSLAQNALRGRSIGLIFEKPSTRTRVSFDAGISSMGGNVLYLGPQDIRLDEREATRDVARVLARYWDAAVLRTFKHSTLEEFYEYFKKPVINGLTEREHPCQALADFLTLKENFKTLKGLTLAYVGDANNVLTSLLFLAAKTGTHLHYACPKSYSPKPELLRRLTQAAKKSGARLTAFSKPEEAVKGAHAVYADVWVSMGEEKIAEVKKQAFKGFQVNRELLERAEPNAILLHCLPAHRGEEITDEAMESRYSRIFDQAENRLHVQKAVLGYLFGKI